MKCNPAEENINPSSQLGDEYLNLEQFAEYVNGRPSEPEPEETQLAIPDDYEQPEEPPFEPDEPEPGHDWRRRIFNDCLTDFGPALVNPIERDGVIVNGRPSEPFFAGLVAMESMILRDPDEGQFYRYNGSSGLWRAETPEAIQQLISARILEASRNRYPFLAQKRSITLLRSIEQQMRGIAEHRGAFTSAKAGRVACLNGCIDVHSGAITAHSPDNYLRNGIPIAFSRDAACSEFLENLIHPSVSDDDAILLQKWFGLAILQRNIAQTILILDGEAGTGKSTIASIARMLVGKTNVSELRTENLDSRFELFRLRTASLLIGADVRGDFLSQAGASRLKALSGGDPLSCEGKGLNAGINITGDFNCLITCNERLRIRLEGDIGAWRRRLLIIRFNQPRPKKRIPDYARQLFEREGAGILNWSMEGARMLLTDIQEHGMIQLSQAQQKRVTDLLDESDSLRAFLQNHVRPGSRDIPKSAIIENYFCYVSSRGWNPVPLQRVQGSLPHMMLSMYNTPESRSIRGADGKQTQGFRNIEMDVLKNETSDPTDEL